MHSSFETEKHIGKPNRILGAVIYFPYTPQICSQVILDNSLNLTNELDRVLCSAIRHMMNINYSRELTNISSCRTLTCITLSHLQNSCGVYRSFRNVRTLVLFIDTRASVNRHAITAAVEFYSGLSAAAEKNGLSRNSCRKFYSSNR